MHEAGYFSENKPVNPQPTAAAVSTPVRGQPLPDAGVIRERRRWLWTGVTIFMLAILLPWAVNLKTKFYDAHRTVDPGDKILADSKRDLQVVFDTMRQNTGAAATSTSSTTELIKSQLKNILAPLLVPSIASSTASSTTNSTASSTIVTTSTAFSTSTTPTVSSTPLLKNKNNNHLSVSSTTSTR